MRASVRWGVSLAALCGAGAWQGAALAQPRGYAIGAQPLPAALAEFSRLSGLQVSAPAALTAGRASPGVSGALEPGVALDRLLAGSGLVGQVQGGTVVLTPAPAGAVELPPVEVEASRGTPRTGTIGAPPPAYAGGQVATGVRQGLLGNQNVFTAPFSSTGYTRQAIDNQQPVTLSDFIRNDPSVSLSFPSYGINDAFTLRGFSVGSSDIGYDGLYGLADFRQPLEHIERIEVVRGPNALLNGRPGLVGGSVNLIPKRATDDPITVLTGRYVSAGIFGQQVDIGRRAGPDNAFGIRLNAARREGDTAIDRVGINDRLVALALDYRGERVRLIADLDYSDTDLGAWNERVGVAPGVPVPRAPDAARLFTQPWVYRTTIQRRAMLRGEWDFAEGWTASAAFGTSASDVRGLSASAPRVADSFGNGTATPSYSGIRSRNDTGELAVRGTLQTGPVTHRPFLTYTNLSSTTSTITISLPGGTYRSNIYDPVLAPRPAVGVLPPFNRTSLAETVSIAFGTQLSILDERAILTLGGRYTEIGARNYAQASGAQTSAYDTQATTPAAALVVRLAPGVFVYGNYIEALESGGIAPTTAANAGTILPAGRSTQVEGGLRVDFGRFGATAALFEIERPTSLQDPTTQVFALTGRQRNRGAELMIFGTPIESVALSGGVTLLDPKAVATLGGQYDGKDAVGTPRVQASLSADWSVAAVPGLGLLGTVFYGGEQYLDQANRQRVPDYARFDIGARYTLPTRSGDVTIRGAVQNVTGANYWASASQGFLSLGSPRTVLLATSFSF